jgi:hypothetical protein
MYCNNIQEIESPERKKIISCFHHSNFESSFYPSRSPSLPIYDRRTQLTTIQISISILQKRIPKLSILNLSFSLEKFSQSSEFRNEEIYAIYDNSQFYASMPLGPQNKGRANNRPYWCGPYYSAALISAALIIVRPLL